MACYVCDNTITLFRLNSSFDHLRAAQKQYNIISKLDRLRIIDNKHNLPWSVYIGVAGMAGEHFLDHMTVITGLTGPRQNGLYGMEGVFSSKTGTITNYTCMKLPSSDAIVLFLGRSCFRHSRWRPRWIVSEVLR